MKIWVLTIRPSGNDGGSLGFAFHSEAAAGAKLARYCRENWRDAGAPQDEATLIQRYFELHEDESADLAPAELED